MSHRGSDDNEKFWGLEDSTPATRPPYVTDAYAAGHIISARGFSGPNPLVNQACTDARAPLKAANININGIFDGFWTKSSRHVGSHTDDFLLEMGSRLKGLTDRTEVLKKLMSLKDDLFAGKFL